MSVHCQVELTTTSFCCITCINAHNYLVLSKMNSCGSGGSKESNIRAENEAEAEEKHFRSIINAFKYYRYIIFDLSVSWIVMHIYLYYRSVLARPVLRTVWLCLRTDRYNEDVDIYITRVFLLTYALVLNHYHSRKSSSFNIL